MQFEHLIALDDPPPLTRQQAWAGLVQRMENPLPFLPSLEACTILERHADHLIRELDFGAARIRDRVTWAEAYWVRFEIEPTGQHAGGSLRISIEEGEAGRLLLRFAYATHGAGSEDEAFGEIIQAAYRQSDHDCVRVIRALAAKTKTP
ncbi:MAG: DUF1857 family protein [Betaproteobacteria bacterium]|nr:DUF1857 family protein [Betaproteobacteria bacterium]MCL2885453.1 DUF1857 family protein [Betaproteobacteria bacterium]